MERIKILVADPRKIMAEELASILESNTHFDVIGIYNSCQEVFSKAFELKPDIVIYSADMPEKLRNNKLRRGRRINNELLPNTKILVLTEEEDIKECMISFRTGVRGHMWKHVSPIRLMSVVESIHAGQMTTSPIIMDKIFNEFVVPHLTKRAAVKENKLNLTIREKDVLKLATLGKRNKEIADALFITENTVKCHMSSILAKLGVCNRQSAAFVLSNANSNLHPR